MSRLPVIEGFVLNRVEDWWITCEACDESELIYGVDKVTNARAWAADHDKTCPGQIALGADA